MKKQLVTVLFVSVALASCKRDANVDFEHQLNPNLGGNSTIIDVSPNAFSKQNPSVVGDDELQFFVGNSLFNKNWVTAPASTTARDGLGPLFNARSCASCHFKDGRGRAPSAGEMATGYLLRLSTGSIDNPMPHPEYGSQLQDQAILGVQPEATIQINYNEIEGKYPDGETYSLRKPSIALSNFKHSNIGTETFISARVAQQMIGLGLLQNIPKSTLLAWADESDANNDGISGRVNRVMDIEKNSLIVGRFGWKSNEANIQQQCAGAFFGDMGLTSKFHTEEECKTGDCADLPNGGTPEVDDDALRQVALYASNLAVPQQRNFEDIAIKKGYNIFVNIGCENCHKSNIKSSNAGTFSPFTDLLLHDMGEGLADGRPDALATGSEWRTAPLWGIGLIKTVNGHQQLLHDGRARSIEEAILWHAGEAEKSNTEFKQLSKNDRLNLIQFIESI